MLKLYVVAPLTTHRKAPFVEIYLNIMVIYQAPEGDKENTKFSHIAPDSKPRCGSTSGSVPLRGKKGGEADL